MAESISQKVSLVGQVIEDLTYEPLDFQRFSAELYQGPKEKLVRVEKTPHYKDNGYFAFTDIGLGNYTLQILGERFQTQQLPITLAPIALDPTKSQMPQLLAQVIFDQPGDNELIVVAKTVTVNGQNKRITFDAATIRRSINAGARVVANGATTELTTKLDAGKVTSARLESVAGIAAGSVVRIIRDRSIRLRFDPYSEALAESTRIVGTVTLANQQPELALSNVLVSITEVNSTAVTVSDVGGARVATVVLGGSKIVLGTERDIQALSDGKGFYTVYFGREGVTKVTLTAALDGYQMATAKNIAVTPRARIRADFQLAKI